MAASGLILDGLVGLVQHFEIGKDSIVTRIRADFDSDLPIYSYPDLENADILKF